MWRFQRGWDRPRRIRELVSQLAGRAYAAKFWRAFFDRYVTEADIERIAELGFDSVRLPLDASLLMEDDPTVTVWLEDGFELIDRCVTWCRKHGIYVILDLHCAPGGQTGSNIDNSIDGDNSYNLPRMLTDRARWDQTIALWCELARRYRDEPTVAMYDLLNEPLPRNTPAFEERRCDLIRFYEECTAAIRSIDTRHILSIEGANWASDPETFTHSFDPGMVIHIHMYGEIPDERLIHRWNDTRIRLNAPILLGETGENHPEWCAATLFQAECAGYSTNFWCWKKANRNSPYTILTPPEWEKIVQWTAGGPAPLPSEAQRIFDAYLEAILLKNCRFEEAMTHAVMRCAPLSLRATDFDPGPLGATATTERHNPWNYREGSNMDIVELDGIHWEHGPGFDSRWEVFGLALHEGEAVRYSARIPEGKTWRISILADAAATPASLDIAPLEDPTSEAPLTVGSEKQTLSTAPFAPTTSPLTTIVIRCTSGCATLREVAFELA